MTEKEFVNKVCLVFEKHFTVEREVWSECRTSRIDIVLTYKEKYHFGIECKIPDKKRGEELGRYVKQASRYTKLKFNTPTGFRIIPIFICPAISYKYFLMNQETLKFGNLLWHRDRHDEHSEHHSFNGFLGSAFNIGEIRSIGYGKYNFSFSNKLIFSTGNYWVIRENGMFHEQNYQYLISKLC